MPTTVQGSQHHADTPEAPETDIELINRTRSGDPEAYAELWERHHDAVRGAARRITRAFDPDDLTQEAFSRTFAALQDGRGPRTTFRPYLYATVRNLAASWSSSDSVSVDPEQFEAVGPTQEFESELVDRTVTARAFRTLPDEWRTVLWYVDVEGMSATEVAPILGSTPNAVAALTYRAREGLRRAWIDTHAESTSEDPECVWTVSHLSAYVRDGLSRRKRNRVEDHLTTCTACSILAEQLDEVASSLRAILVPLVLGPAVVIGGESVGPAAILPAQASGVTAEQARTAAEAGRNGWHHPFTTHPKASWGLTASIVAVAVTSLALTTLGGDAAPEASASPLADPPTTSEPSDRPTDDLEPGPTSAPEEKSTEDGSSDGEGTDAGSDAPAGATAEPEVEDPADEAAEESGADAVRRTQDADDAPTSASEDDPEPPVVESSASPDASTPAPETATEPDAADPTVEPDPAPAPDVAAPELLHPDPGAKVALRDVDGSGTADDLLVWIAGDPDRVVAISIDGGAEKQLVVTEDAVPYFLRSVSAGGHTLTARYLDGSGSVSVSFTAVP
ncbi:sigma-70 family RNA polymerase sigma factor [Paraoerskovia marina]|uniref:sigma-70 family RNA polymerase sigma factor n=1 Tax=Paraoerskovia marina TaxID=545619 RepID=UPI0006941B7F|nr:sigma-70 family RNA polymerase sigma factor [Paraoerskovia marina]